MSPLREAVLLQMRLRGFAAKTVEAYIYAMKVLCRFYTADRRGSVQHILSKCGKKPLARNLEPFYTCRTLDKTLFVRHDDKMKSKLIRSAASTNGDDSQVNLGLNRGKRVLYGFIFPLLCAPVALFIEFLFMLDKPMSGGGGDPFRGEMAILTIFAFSMWCVEVMAFAAIPAISFALLARLKTRRGCFLWGTGLFLGTGWLAKLAWPS